MELTEYQKAEVLALLEDDDLSEDEFIEKIASLPYAEAANEYLVSIFVVGS